MWIIVECYMWKIVECYMWIIVECYSIVSHECYLRAFEASKFCRAVFKTFSLSQVGLGVLGSQAGGPQNLQQPPMCPSPSAHSDSSSGNGRLSSAGSEPGTHKSRRILLLQLNLYMQRKP